MRLSTYFALVASISTKAGGEGGGVTRVAAATDVELYVAKGPATGMGMFKEEGPDSDLRRLRALILCTLLRTDAVAHDEGSTVGNGM